MQNARVDSDRADEEVRTAVGAETDFIGITDAKIGRFDCFRVVDMVYDVKRPHLS